MNITDTRIEMLPISQLAENKGQIVGVKPNPRVLRDDKYKRLLASLREDDLTGVLPLKVYGYAGEWVVIGGNMRLKALREIGGVDKVPCIIIPDAATPEVLNKIVIIDNSTYGDWDWDMLANEWNADELQDWGLDVPDDVNADQFGEEFQLPDGDKQPFQQITFSLADAQAEMIKQAIEDAKGLEEYKHQDTFGNTNSNGNAIAIIVQQWVDARK